MKGSVCVKMWKILEALLIWFKFIMNFFRRRITNYNRPSQKRRLLGFYGLENPERQTENSKMFILS